MQCDDRLPHQGIFQEVPATRLRCSLVAATLSQLSNYSGQMFVDSTGELVHEYELVA
jgi:hypothetical protein